MNIIMLTVHQMPGRTREARQAAMDKHGRFWFVTEARYGSWIVESVVSGKRARYNVYAPTPKRNDTNHHNGRLQFI